MEGQEAQSACKDSLSRKSANPGRYGRPLNLEALENRLAPAGLINHILLHGEPAQMAAIGTLDQSHGARSAISEFGQVPLSFEANLGQTDPQVQFLSRGSGSTMFLTPTASVLSLQKLAQVGPSAGPLVDADAIYMQFVGANPTPRLVGEGELPGKVNDFTGGDLSRAHTNIPTFGRVEYKGVYPGIDLAYYSQSQSLEYDFVVAPGADPSAIRLDIQGVERLSLNASGDLVLHTVVGDVIEHAPILYQVVNGARQEVRGQFVVQGSQVGFQVGAHDQTKSLVIDPVLSYSTFLGDNGYNAVNGIAVDGAGNAYVTGQAGTLTFPHTPGAYQSPNPGAFVTKLNPQGNGLVYSAFVDGITPSIAVDSSGNAYITGYAGLLATTPGAFVSGGFGFDAFVTKLNPQGSDVIYSARIGGDFDDFGHGIAVDAAGDAFITGVTYSYAATNHFPVLNAVQPTQGGNFYDDAFVTELNPSGSGLVFSTFLGGIGVEEGQGIAVDPAGNAYVTGYTSSPNFLITPGAWRTSLVNIDSFVTKFTHTGTVAYSTFLGGSNAFAAGIAVDAAGHAYIAGDDHGEFIPTTPGTYNTTGGPGFITKFNPTGSGLVYSTYLTDGIPRAIAADGHGNAGVTGYIGLTTGQYAMVPYNAVQQTNGGGSDVFVFEVNSVGAAPLIASYMGGTGQDQGLAIAADSTGSLYVAGTTNGFNFPTTPGSFQPNFLGTDGGQNEGFVARSAV